MAKIPDIGPEHSTRTRRRNLRYFFYAKHHKRGPSPDAQWCLEPEEEFEVFDVADCHDLSNEKGDLFGLSCETDGSFLVIGTRGEQIAEFPVAPPDSPWHGYPIYPIARHEDGRRSQPPLDALGKMVDQGILTSKQKSRLAGGKTI